MSILRRYLLAVAIATALAAISAVLPAHAQTPCPMVSDEVSVLSVVIIGAPQPVLFSTYDIPKLNLWLQFSDQTYRFFMGVPQTEIRGTANWSVISRHHQALMQERSPCPLLSESGPPLQPR
jgi:hypothetical protein